MTPILKLAGVGLAYESRVVLRNISFEVPASGCTVLLGPSGTGKSSLLRALAGVTAGAPMVRLWGEALYRGQPCVTQNRPALVGQKAQALVSSVMDNLVDEWPERWRLTRGMQTAKLKEMLERRGQGGLADRLEDQVIDLPIEQQRVVAILRKTMAQPALLMVDEPTANLSDEQAEPILALLHHLSSEAPLLVVQHHLAQTRRLADKVVLIASGVTQECAPTELFFTAPKSEAAQAFLRSGSCPETKQNLAEPAETITDEPIKRRGTELDPAGEGSAQAVSIVPAIGTRSRSATLGPRGFVWLIDGHVAGTPWPGIVRDTAYDLRILREAGVTRLLSLTEQPFPAAQAAMHGIRCAWSPIPDMHAPSPSQAVDLCRDIDRYLRDGERVALHCKAGLGRTGTALAAYWLWRHQGALAGASALAHIRSLQPGMVQSEEQETFLTRFADLLRDEMPEVSGAVAAHGPLHQRASFNPRP